MFDQLFRAKHAATGGRRCEYAAVADFEERAASVLERNAFDFCRCGAGGEQTARENRSAFGRLRIRGRCLRQVGTRALGVHVLGASYRLPIGIAPVALQKLGHTEGEKATAKAARTFGAPFILSALSSCCIEEVAEAVPKTPKWLQIYILKDRELTESLVRRAEKARFKALVVTVDTPGPGISRAELRNPLVLPPKVTFANFTSADNKTCAKNVVEYVKNQLDPNLGWDAIRWIMTITQLPIVLKGIMCRADAKIAADLGVQGIIVSNNGGRQLDCAPASIEVLAEVVDAVGDRVEVMLDSGVTQGTDAFKAFALGARLVFIGRAALWGLSAGGQQGVEDVLDILRNELDSTMLNAGCRTIADITRNHVLHESQFFQDYGPNRYNTQSVIANNVPTIVVTKEEVQPTVAAALTTPPCSPPSCELLPVVEKPTPISIPKPSIIVSRGNVVQSSQLRKKLPVVSSERAHLHQRKVFRSHTSNLVMTRPTREVRLPTVRVDGRKALSLQNLCGSSCI